MFRRQRSIVWIAAFAAIGLCCGVSQTSNASIVVSSPDLPPVSGIFAANNIIAAHFTAPGVDLVLKCLTHGVTPGTIAKSTAGTNQVASFGTELLAVVDGFTPNGSLSDVPFRAVGQTSTVAFNWPSPLPAVVPIEIVAMSLTSTAPISGILIRESPTKASNGTTEVEDIGGGLFSISSFFDVFTELSLDGGQSWIPSNGATRLELLPAPPNWVPEPSSFAAWSTLGFIGIGWQWRRLRRVKA